MNAQEKGNAIVDNFDPAFVVTAAAKDLIINRGTEKSRYSADKSIFAVGNGSRLSSRFAMRMRGTKPDKGDKDAYAHRVISVADFKLIMPHMHINLLESQSFALLARIGTRNMTALLKAKNMFFGKAKKADVERLIPKKFIDALNAQFKKKYNIRIEQKKRAVYGRRRGSTSLKKKPTAILSRALSVAGTNTAVEGLIKLYAIYATQLCTALGKDYEKYGKAIISYAILGKPLAPYKLPAGFKNAFKAGAKAIKLKDGLTIDKLKVASFKGAAGHALANQLPQMYKDYIANSSGAKAHKEKQDGLKEKVRAAKTAYTQAQKAARKLNTDAARNKERVAYRKYWKMKSDFHHVNYMGKRGSAKKKTAAQANELLYKAVGAELYDFYRLVIPALKKPEVSPFLSKTGKALSTSEAATLRRGIKRLTRLLAKATGVVAKRKYQKEIDEREAKLADAVMAQPTVKTWMVPFVGANVSVQVEKGAKKVSLDSGLLSHRLTTRANTGKIKPNDVELTVELDKNAATLLTLGGVSKIIEACGSSVKAFKSVFKNVISLVAPLAFIAEFTERSVNALETETGKVSNTRLLRLNGITKEEIADIEKSYAKEIKAWKPEKDELSSYIASFMKNDKAIAANHYEVVKSSSAELAANRKMINQFFSHEHGVKALRVNKSWEIHPSKRIQTILKNAKDSKGSKLEVIRNVFHGTYRQAGSIILARGFKIAGTKVTARAMGDVLYIAPNIDKSAQYMRAGGVFRGDGTKVTGMIFMGDCIVSGDPARDASGAKGTFGWTKLGSFKTEEIGLTNPGSQFIIRKAMIVTMEKSSSHMAGARPRGIRRFGPAPKPRAKKGAVVSFEAKIPLSSYSVSTPSNTKGKKVSKEEVEKKVVKAPAKKF